MSETLGNWIAGQACPALGAATIDDIAPATGAIIARVPRSQAEDVDRAAESARAAFENGWAKSDRLARADVLDAIASKIEAQLEDLARLESMDTGKPIRLTRGLDIPRAALNFRFFAGALRHDETGFHAMDGAINYTLRRPIGAVGLITPWNLPLYLLTWKVAPALAMGNTIVAKPSELTPLSADRLAQIINEVLAERGYPEGVFNLVHGLGAECGQAIVEHPWISAISFTGGTVTGQRVAATAAPLFKKLSLELGGKNPTLIFADADFDAALEGALRAGFTNQGQICLCGSRILVEESIAERFTEALVARVEAMKIGDPSDPETELGALISLAHRDKVEGYFALAEEEGGRIRCGGGRPVLEGDLRRGAFVKPTVISGLTASCRTAQEEIFGPIVTVHSFRDEAEALQMANGVRYGLSASLWTRDLARAHRVSAALEVGMVWVNTWLLRDLRVPFGGVKASGVGREGGKYSLEFFSETRNVCIKL